MPTPPRIAIDDDARAIRSAGASAPVELEDDLLPGKPETAGTFHVPGK
jgi:hypothetical protein